MSVSPLEQLLKEGAAELREASRAGTDPDAGLARLHRTRHMRRQAKVAAATMAVLVALAITTLVRVTGGGVEPASPAPSLHVQVRSAVLHPSQPRIVVTASVSNPGDRDIWVSAYRSDGIIPGFMFVNVPWQPVPARGAADVKLELYAYDCSVAPKLQPTWTGARTLTRAPAVPLTVASVPNPPLTGAGADPVPVELDAESAARIDAALRQICLGAPRVTDEVVSVRPAASSGPSWTVVTRLSADADSARPGMRGKHVALPNGDVGADLDQVRSGWGGSISDVMLSFAAGHGAATFTWSPGGPPGYCTYATDGPPSLPIMLVHNGREYDMDVPIADPRMLTALRGACHGAPNNADARSAGWLPSGTTPASGG